MPEQSITCPQCDARIPLSEALFHQIQEATRRDVEADAARKFQAEKERIVKEALRIADEKRAVELKDLEATVQEQRKKIEENQRAELELRRRQRELEDQKKAADLEVQRTLDRERKRIEEETFQKAAEQGRQKLLEMEKREADLKKLVDDLKRKAEQGSQQTQGEVVELELEGLLRSQFPYDEIEPVAKGVRGADVLQRVHNKNGQHCGTIIWELKQTKLWSDGWIDKLKDDQRSVKAELAVLLTSTLPKGVSNFGQVGGVWVTNQACALSVAAVMRMALIQVGFAKTAAEGKQGKMEAVYNYLLGTEFRQRIEAVIDASMGMRDQLDREKRAYTKLWSEREKQIERVVTSLGGIHGDLNGLGASLPQIKALELEAPDEPAKEPAKVAQDLF